MAQTDLFGHTPAQSELFASHEAVRIVPQPTAETVRHKMLFMLEQLRKAERMPWPADKARLNAVIFPQMADWLPKEEREQLCFEFKRELERVRLAEAA